MVENCQRIRSVSFNKEARRPWRFDRIINIDMTCRAACDRPLSQIFSNTQPPILRTYETCYSEGAACAGYFC